MSITENIGLDLLENASFYDVEPQNTNYHKIDAAFGSLTNVPPAMSIVNFTSANFKNNVYSVEIPYDRFVFAVITSNMTSTPKIIGIATKSNLSALGLTMHSKPENQSYNCFTYSIITVGAGIPVVNAQTGDAGASAAVSITSNGLKLDGANFSTKNGQLMYMKL